MALVLADRVQETTTTTGTGSYSLAGAKTGFRAFSTVLSSSDTTYYTTTNGTDWEVGIATFTSPSTLARTTILSSSNSNNAVNWSAGNKDVFITYPAGLAVYVSGSSIVPGTTAILPVANGGTGLSSLGTGVATFLGTPSSANLAAAVTDETGTGLLVFGTNPTLTGLTLAGEAACADNLVTRATLKDYAVEGSAIGNTGATRTLDLTVANFFSATLDQACAFTFSNPPASGDFGCFVLELTNGGAFAITWPPAVNWPAGTAPTLTASGKDQLVFTTRDGGTTYFGFVAGLDIKSP
jgi:hypothetical protein